MAETKKTVEKTEERVPLLIPMDPNPKAPKEVFISVNFENFIIKKGETVLVPPEVKEVYENSIKAVYEASEYVEANGVKEA